MIIFLSRNMYPFLSKNRNLLTFYPVLQQLIVVSAIEHGYFTRVSISIFISISVLTKTNRSKSGITETKGATAIFQITELGHTGPLSATQVGPADSQFWVPDFSLEDQKLFLLNNVNNFFCFHKHT